MAYDLEEQESIDQMKAWWDRWGTPVTAAVCVVCLGFAGWNGWNWWQRNEAAKAAGMYAQLQHAVQTNDQKNVSSLSTGLVTEYGSTIYAPLAALSAANVALDSGNFAEAKTKLEWVIEKSGRPEYDALARSRLAGVLFDEGKLDDALKTLEAAKPDSSQLGLYHDREGDIWAAKGDLKKAREAWTKAAQATDHQNGLARVIELKLANLPQEG